MSVPGTNSVPSLISSDSDGEYKYKSPKSSPSRLVRLLLSEPPIQAPCYIPVDDDFQCVNLGQAIQSLLTTKPSLDQPGFTFTGMEAIPDPGCSGTEQSAFVAGAASTGTIHIPAIYLIGYEVDDEAGTVRYSTEDTKLTVDLYCQGTLWRSASEALPNKVDLTLPSLGWREVIDRSQAGSGQSGFIFHNHIQLTDEPGPRVLDLAPNQVDIVGYDHTDVQASDKVESISVSLHLSKGNAGCSSEEASDLEESSSDEGESGSWPE